MSPLSESATAPPGLPVTPEILTGGLTPIPLRLPFELRQDLERLVEASYPFEACGLLVGRAEERQVSVVAVYHARNLRVDRARDRFLLDPTDHLAADRAARARGLEIVGFWHSHPDHPARPSITDLEAAWEGYSYLIISTPAFGANVFQSWRLKQGRFQEEKIHHLPTETTS